MSAEEKLHERPKKRTERYMWLGFGDYSVGEGQHGFLFPGGVRADPSIFNKLLEFLGLKDKPKNTAKEDSDDVRDPNW